MKWPSRHTVIVVLGLYALVLAIYWPVIRGGGFFFDDRLLLLDNKAIWRLDGLYEIWLTARHPDYFPLTSSSFWLEARIFGHAAWGYHLTNVLLHGGSAVLLWRLFQRLGIRWALLGAVLFAVSPINAETVSWISERKNTLSIVFLIAAVWHYLNFQERGRGYGWSLACYLLSLLAKTSGVMLPLVLLVLAWWRRGRVGKRDVAATLPFWAVGLLMGVVTLWFQQHQAIGALVVRDDSALSRVATAGCAIWWYLGKAIVPVHLMFVYPRWDVLGRFGMAGWLPGIAFVAVLAGLWRGRRSAARHVLAGLLIYALLLLPMLGFANIYFMRYSLVADYWQYQATAVVAAALAAGAGRVAAFMRRRGGRGLWVGAVGVVVALLVTQSVATTRLYRSEEAIWRDTLAKNPAAWVAEENVGVLLLSRSPAEAMVRLRRAYALAPGEAMNAINLGLAMQRAGDRARALALYREAITAPHGDATERASACMNAAAILVEAGEYSPAAELLRQAMAMDRVSGVAAYRLGALEARRGNWQAAIEDYRASLLREPESGQARYALAAAEAKTGDLAGAARDVAILLNVPAEDPVVRQQVEQLRGAASGPASAASQRGPFPGTDGGQRP